MSGHIIQVRNSMTRWAAKPPKWTLNIKWLVVFYSRKRWWFTRHPRHFTRSSGLGKGYLLQLSRLDSCTLDSTLRSAMEKGLDTNHDKWQSGPNIPTILAGAEVETQKHLRFGWRGRLSWWLKLVLARNERFWRLFYGCLVEKKDESFWGAPGL